MHRLGAFLVGLLLVGGVPLSAVAQSGSGEITFWESVRDSSDRAELEAYLSAYPNGQFAPLARLRLNKLQGSAAGQLSGQSPGTVPSSSGLTTAAAPGSKKTAPVQDCDRLATHPLDAKRVTVGVDYDWIDTARAVPACRTAVAAFPEELRFRYQLGRALEKAGSSEASEHLLAAANGGYPAAMTRIGQRYLTGVEFPLDTGKGIDWLTKAAARGSAQAMTLLGIAFMEDKEVPKDPDRGAGWLLKGAENGDVDAMYLLAFAYLEGDGVQQSTSSAIRWLEKASKKGDWEAALELALIHEKGRGVRKDLQKAFHWYRKAADHGSAYAHYRLAQIYRKSLVVERDDRASAEHLFRAIQDGYRISPAQLASETRPWGARFRSDFQQILKEEGFYDGAIDGSFGSQTKKAMEALSWALEDSDARVSDNDTENREMRVNIPELNVFPRASVRSQRLGSVIMDDTVVVRQRQTDHNGDQWARVCTHRYCGWVAAEFLAEPPASSVETGLDRTETVEAPVAVEPQTAAPSSETLPSIEEGLGELD
ncbi:SEL1-like repeat protein [Roseibium aggregatum]|uniref:SEL1-like repeat protein n=1 Tax=Roseibium aggregatum TaxID=187304 RepID=A0A939EDH2_9HYPH|nr:SEL1-like repeat protein [Roseibium aggregatum]MBN9670088.1 SEL1-like repeat protein [Roseibium aggregatum]